MSDSDEWTVGRLLTWTTGFLKSNGAESPRLEAEVLLAHVRQCPRIALYTSFGDVATTEERTAFRGLIQQRAKGAPVAYLVGHKEFYSLEFEVDPRCLIPRPETEHLVVAALDWIRNQHAQRAIASEPIKLADVGTGSGCVAITLAKQAESIQIVATDISSDALAIARGNAAKHGVEHRIEFIESDLLASLGESASRLDMIVSNPPYVSEDEFQRLDRTVKEFEPRGALVSDGNGASVSLRLFEQAESRLVDGGVIMLESSPSVIPILLQSLQGCAQWTLKPVIKDLAGHPRVLVAEFHP